MKKTVIVLFSFFFIISRGQLHAQDFNISFAKLGLNETPDSVYIENIDQSTHLTLNGDDVLQLVNEITGVNELSNNTILLKVYPNPIQENATIEYSNFERGEVNIQLCDIQGKLIINQNHRLEKGIFYFTLNGLNKGNYFIHFICGSNRASTSISSVKDVGSSPNILLNEHFQTANTLKSAVNSIQNAEKVQMQYNSGDTLKLTAYIKKEASKIINLVPNENQTIEFSFPSTPVVNFNVNTTKIVPGNSVSFTDASTNNPASWNWNFGDGTTSKEQNPTHTYDYEGTYNVTLTAINEYGSISKSKTNYISVTIYTSLYGIKHDSLYGYINSKGEIVLDNLSEGLLGEINGEKTFTFNVNYVKPPGGFMKMPVINWKCYYRNGTVLNISNDYVVYGGNYNAVDMYSFFEGRAIVSKNIDDHILLGFVDENINEVIPCQYKWVSRFSDGLAAVLDTTTKKIGFIYKSGNYVIQPQYFFNTITQSHEFYNGKAVVATSEGNYKIIDKNNNIIVDLSDFRGKNYIKKTSNKVTENLLPIETITGWGYVNMIGKWVVEPILKEAGDFKNGFAVVRSSDWKYYYINKTGNQAFSGEFIFASDFDDNDIAWVGTEPTQNNRNPLGFFIDKSGNQAFPLQTAQTSFINGLALIYDYTIKLWKYINTSGVTILIPSGQPYIFRIGAYYQIFTGNFSSEGVAFLTFDDDTWGYINKSGDILWRSQEKVSLVHDELLYLYN